MVLNSIVTSFRGGLSTRQTLELANFHLENARKTKDSKLALVLCDDAESALSHVKRAAKWALKDADEQDLREGIASAYSELGKLQDHLGQSKKAQASYKTVGKWGGNVQDQNQPKQSSDANKQCRDIAKIPSHIFAENVRPPAISFEPPKVDERLSNTPQLACCLSLLRASQLIDDILDPDARSWLKVIKDDSNEQERLKILATDVIRAFKRDELKNGKAVAEVVYLAPVLEKDDFGYLLKELCSGIDQSILLDVHQLEGLGRLIQGADSGYLDSDDLVKILDLLSRRLKDTHNQSPEHMYKLTLVVSHVLDAMADTDVKGLDREKLHEPLSSYFEDLKGSSDPYMVYQAAYAYQALLCVPDDETLWQATLQRTGKVIKGVSGLVSAVKGLDLNGFIEGLENIQKGLAGASKVVHVIKNAYDDVTTLAASGKDFLDCLKEGLSFQRKCAWYSALRGADSLIREGQVAKFKELVCEAPCRRDAAFQWGVCQRLGEIAANPMWDSDTRRSAVTFLGEIYRGDTVWGQQSSVKQWILNILMQLSSLHVGEMQSVETLLQELKSDGDNKKQGLYRVCREGGPSQHPLKVALPELATPSLLDRAQKRPDVEGHLRLLKNHRLKERGDAVYIPPQAKASLQASDDVRFPLMDKFKDFLNSDQTVFLLLGDSGAGKSTFNRELECDLWQKYVKKTGAIPLHINLPAIDKPEHDMVAKQLRKSEFTESQIRELKFHRKFILICDGYDESQQTHNLYTSNRLNEAGEWSAKMVISCRSEYLGVDYRDRFQPRDRNQRSDSELFQQAAITPFSSDQVQEYIKQYVHVHQPLWEVGEYKQALEHIPSLKDLVKNPFLMALSLEVLPRMVDPGQRLSAARITRVALYDQFIEHWLERGKRRLGEKELSPQTRAAFESLSAEGFSRNGIHFMKKLAMAIYKEQGGQPVVEYSRFVDEGSWKDVFFSQGEDKQLLREACPLARNGNQHRFIHRSLLEYGLALAVFDPRDKRMSTSPESGLDRRGSVSSDLSFEIRTGEEVVSTIAWEPDVGSPLAWRYFVKEASLLQFLEERVQQEPVFKQQLLAYVEHSKVDKKWRTAAANAITILVRAGERFIGADLQGIRIPGADLSYGMFDSANLQGADLRKANLRGVWLRQADLSRAQMTSVQFGELPSLRVARVVYSCAYSPDGESFAAGLDDGNIHVYKTSNWEHLWTLSGHTNAVSVAFSPKNDQIASAGHDKTIRLWDAETGSHRLTLTGHTNWVRSVAYSPQGDVIASGSFDTTIRLWDVVTGDCRRTLSGHTDYVNSIAYSPHGNQIVSGSEDKTVRLWDSETGECRSILNGHSDEVNSVVFSPQGEHLASASDDKTVQLWDVKTGACRLILTGHSGLVECLAYSPRGDQIASGSMDGTVRLWDAETGACRHTLTGHGSSVFTVVYSPKGDYVASGSLDKTVRLWNVEAGASRNVSSGHSMNVWNVKCSPTGCQIVSCCSDNTIRLWDAETGACSQILRGHRVPVYSVAYSPRGDQITSGGYDNEIRLWDVETGTCRLTLTGHTDWVQNVAFSPQGDMLASAGNNETIRLWDVISGECRRTLSGHADYVYSIAYSTNGTQIVSGSWDKTVRLWNVETGECRHTLTDHGDLVRCVIFSPQGYQIASASQDKTVRLWDVETGACCLTITGHTEEVMSVSYSPKGDLLATGSLDKSVRLWDVASGQCRGVIENLPDCINSVTWSSTCDTKYLITGSQDGSVAMWEVVDEGDVCHGRLRWCATAGILVVTGVSLQDVHGLSLVNHRLLKQRGAVGEPDDRKREASKKVIAMASVVSSLKESLNAVPDSRSAANVLDGRPDQPTEAADDKET